MWRLTSLKADQLKAGKMEPEMSQEKTELSIKEELETYHDDLEVKTEFTEDHIHTEDDNPFSNVQLEVKQEILSLSLEKESTDSQCDDGSAVKSENIDDNLDTEMKIDLHEDADVKFSKSEVKSEMGVDESLVSYDFPDFDDSQSMDSDDLAALSQVEACLHDDVDVKSEDDGFEDQKDFQIKDELQPSITNTHLISNKLIKTTSTVTHPQDGVIESTTRTLVMEIMDMTSGNEHLAKMSNPEEILPTTTNYDDTKEDYDDFQLNSITGNVLTLEQEAFGLLKAKRKRDLSDKTYECTKCGKMYRRKHDLTRHLGVHEAIEKRALGIIKGQKTRCENRSKKVKEEEDKVKKEGYECTCGKVFQRRSRLETCLRSHNMYSDTDMYPCLTCKKQFKDKQELALHRKRLHRKRFPCKFCPTDYNTRKELFKHLQVHQKVQLMEYKVISEVVKGKQKLKCFMCAKTYSELTELKCHVMEDHEEPYHCPQCNCTFPKLIDCGNHMKSLHPEGAGQSVLDVLQAFSLLVQAWKCEECGLQFHEADKLAMHQIEKHTPDLKMEPQFQCTDCRRVFISQKGLTSHRRVHHSTENVEESAAVETGVMCLECRKMCKDMTALTSHMRFHSPDRKYPCKFCDFRFATPEKRKAHAEIHTGDMKFVCFICEYQCSSENRLKQHKLSLKHLNMKEYLLTGKPLVEESTSTSKEKVKKKRKKESRSESETECEVACDICGEQFRSEAQMLEHKQTHPFIEFPNDDKPSRIFFK